MISRMTQHLATSRVTEQLFPVLARALVSDPHIPPRGLTRNAYFEPTAWQDVLSD